MVSLQTDIPMEQQNIINEKDEFHLLQNKGNLWAHLPHDIDWTVNSYKQVFQFKTIEETQIH